METLDQPCQVSSIYLLGIDGGGTKTALALTDENQQVIRRVYADCCNPMDIGIEAAKDTLRRAILEVCDGIDFSSVVTFAGIAGGTSGDVKPQLKSFFAEFGFAAFENDSDNRNLVAAGLGQRDGVTMIMGTGICAFVQHNGQLSRVAGWGYLFDDGGCGYNLGRDALAAHFHYVDGSGEATLLSALIEAKYPDPQLLLGAMYQGGKKAIASFAPLVFQAVEQKDPIACTILDRNMAYAANVLQVATRDFTDDHIPVVLAGGLTAQPKTIEHLKANLQNETRYDIRGLDCEPLMGAVQLAHELYLNRKDERL